MQHEQNEAPLLSAHGLSKSFGAVRVLHNVDFEVRAGEVLGILGPNGAGKTTLFNLISGDIRDHGGDIRFRGQPLAGPRSNAAVRVLAGRIRFRFPMVQ